MNAYVFQDFMKFRLSASGPYVHSKVHSVTSKSNCGSVFIDFLNQKIGD